MPFQLYVSELKIARICHSKDEESVAIVFLTSLAGGFLGVLALCRMDQVAWKWVRLVAVLALALMALATTAFVLDTGGRNDRWSIGAAVLACGAAIAGFVVMALAPLAPAYARLVRMLGGAGGLLAVASSLAWGFNLRLWPADRVHLPAALIGQALGAFLAGTVSLAMLLGHAYLTQTSMTIAPLRRLARLFALAVGLRFGWALVVGGGLYWYGWSRGELTTSLFLSQSLILMLIVRGAVGLVLPAIFAYMVMETARLRATQSATGILYFTLILVYIGELTSQYLVRETGIGF